MTGEVFISISAKLSKDHESNLLTVNKDDNCYCSIDQISFSKKICFK